MVRSLTTQTQPPPEAWLGDTHPAHDRLGLCSTVLPRPRIFLADIPARDLLLKATRATMHKVCRGPELLCVVNNVPAWRTGLVQVIRIRKRRRRYRESGQWRCAMMCLCTTKHFSAKRRACNRFAITNGLAWSNPCKEKEFLLNV